MYLCIVLGGIGNLEIWELGNGNWELGMGTSGIFIMTLFDFVFSFLKFNSPSLVDSNFVIFSIQKGFLFPVFC